MKMGKITMQDIADSLSVSRVTVWKVFNNQPGVSDALRNTVLEKANELGYSTHVHPEQHLNSHGKIVSVIVSRPESSIFWTNIIHHAAQELALNDISLMYTYVPPAYTNDFSLPAILTSGAVDGVIVLNVYDRYLTKLIDDLPMSKVFLDTIPERGITLNGDLLLIEGSSTTYHITHILVERGCRSIGFIGDIEYALTNLDRFDGFQSCMKESGLTVNNEFCLTHKIDIYSYQTEVSKFLDKIKKLPQAFVCASDFVASFVYTYFDENPDRIPPDGIIITGFDGSTEYPNVSNRITTALVPTNLLGCRLAEQVHFRIDHPAAPFEVTYLYPHIITHNGTIKK